MSTDTRTEAEAAAAARIAATPDLVAVDGDSNKAALAFLPPGWTFEWHVPVDDPVRPKGTITTRTAAGFAAEMARLKAAGQTPVVYLQDDALFGHPDRTSIEIPAHDDLIVMLLPELAPELKTWINAEGMRYFLNQWEALIEDFSYAIDSVEAVDAPSAAEVLLDARTWDVEIRRIKAENGSEEAKDDLEARVRSGAMSSFKIRIPIFEHAIPVDLLVRIDRDLGRQQVSARIPQLEQIIRWGREAIFADAAEIGEFTPVI